jgi:uncharacterized protein DUF4236
MGWNFRRSLNLGPLRVNSSKSGFGFSVGARGFRAGKDVKGRKYTQTSIPGTGIYRRDYLQNTKNPIAAGTGKQRSFIWLLCVGGALILYFVIRVFS